MIFSLKSQQAFCGTWQADLKNVYGRAKGREGEGGEEEGEEEEGKGGRGEGSTYIFTYLK